jgi:hypothetical protein
MLSDGAASAQGRWIPGRGGAVCLGMSDSTPSGPSLRLPRLAAAAIALVIALPLAGQQEPREVVRLEAEPAELRVTVGASADFAVTARDPVGEAVEVGLRFAAPAGGVRVEEGRVTGLEVGAHEVVVTPLPTPGVTWDPEDPPVLRIPVEVGWPPVSEVRIDVAPGTLYAGTTLRHGAVPVHADGSARPEAEVRWSTSDRAVATVDRFGNVTAHRPGTVRVIAESDGARSEVQHEVRALPAVRLDISLPTDRIRTGDVVDLTATAMAADGSVVRDVPLTWSVAFEPRPEDGRHAGGGGGRLADGRFVAEMPGRYTLLAQAGTLVARQVLEVTPRGAARTLRTVARTEVDGAPLSGIRVWQQGDAVHGITSVEGSGAVHLWDLSDPSAPRRLASLDAGATVVALDVAPGGHYAALLTASGEPGAAGDTGDAVVLVDLTDPAEPRAAGRYAAPEGGAVRRALAAEGHLHLVTGGGRLVILDVGDLARPHEAGSYRHFDSPIQDAGVDGGVAYLAVGRSGVAVVDVGGGGRGGTPESPEPVRDIAPPAGEVHHIALFRTGGGLNLLAGEAGGMQHVIDLSDPGQPRPIARLALPSELSGRVGSADDVLYAAGGAHGLHLFDLSGDLLGDLHRQGRQVAHLPATVRAAASHGDHLFLVDDGGALLVLRLD